MSAAALEALEEAERAFNAAMVSNDPIQIAACITQDWVLVTPERGPIPAQAILSAIGSGVLSHDTMTKTTHHVHLADRTPACSVANRYQPTNGSPTSITGRVTGGGAY
ncbi:DUF4440 domain-containing protein [Rhizobium leguminosarum]|uniref:DUF4440 domain-containing protein n=1 Tax=Rhizobium leguminosarum TaxID=384 RepID=UPI001C9387D4|nr:DUF4440 domain-containing protein [Rhizobium leguminosarum]